MVEHRQHQHLKLGRGRHQPVRKRSGQEVRQEQEKVQREEVRGRESQLKTTTERSEVRKLEFFREITGLGDQKAPNNFWQSNSM